MKIVYIGKRTEFRSAFLVPGRTLKQNVAEEVTDEEGKRLLAYPNFKLAVTRKRKEEEQEEPATQQEDPQATEETPEPVKGRRRRSADA